jgi:TRAP-type C4-dicarboxylate transport system permease small subunit
VTGGKAMRSFLTAVYRTDLVFHAIAGATLAIMMVVTLLDVIMRNLGHPIVGSVEIISFCGAVIIGFAIPYASWKKTHVYVDILIDKLSSKNRKVVNAATRLLGIALFVFIGFNFIRFGIDLVRSGEVSASFKLPYYPIAWGLAVSCFLQGLTLVADLVKTIGGENE